jgi:hypothetical protein
MMAVLSLNMGNFILSVMLDVLLIDLPLCSGSASVFNIMFIDHLTNFVIFIYLFIYFSSFLYLPFHNTVYSSFSSR